MKSALQWLALLSVLTTISAYSQKTQEKQFGLFDLPQLRTFSAFRSSSEHQYAKNNDDEKRIMPGQTLVIADLSGPGKVVHIWMTAVDTEFAWPRLLRLRVYYDGEKTPSVDSPVGDFFGVGHGYEKALSSMMVQNSSAGRARNSYWPMPFHKSCRITVTNEGNVPTMMFYYHVDWKKESSLPPDSGYFHAYYRQERPAVSGKNYEFLSIRGRGQYVGTVMSVLQSQVGWFGEGDDLFYVDGADRPQLTGTGTEDYFNAAWGLRVTKGNWAGITVAEGERTGARLSGYRWHVPDPIPFRQSIWAGIEHVGWTYNQDGSLRASSEERPDFFSSVAFWYQQGINQELPEPPYGEARLPLGNARRIAVTRQIKGVTASGGKAAVQPDVDWGKDLLLFHAEGQGSRLNIPIEIPRSGHYELAGEMATAPDYGEYYVLLDGHFINLDNRQAATSEVPHKGPQIFHNYSPEASFAEVQPLGWVFLKKGRHALSFVCVGKDNRSSGYNLGVVDIVLEKLPVPSEDTHSRTPRKLAPELPPLPPSPPAGEPVYRGLSLRAYLGKLRHDSEAMRPDTIRAIGSFGSDAGPGVSAVKGALRDRSASVRSAAAWALSQIGPTGAEAVPQLARALSDSSPRVRSLAAVALQSMGSRAAQVVPELIRALNDPVAYVRCPAADALAAIGTRQAYAAVQPLAKRLLVKDEEFYVLRSAARALGNMGDGAKAALPALQQARRNPRIAATVEEAILKIEGKPVPAWW